MDSKIIKDVELAIKEYKTIEVPDIKSNKDYLKASDSVKFLNDKFKFAEDARKKLTQPLVASQKEINSAFKTLTDPLTALLGEVKNRMLGYMQKKEAEQIAYEQKKMADNPEDSEVIVHDKVAKIKDSEFSTNTKKTVTKYRVKDALLQDIVEIKQLAMKEYLKNHPLPDFVESYEESSIVVRTK